jgi:hypothetical protein
VALLEIAQASKWRKKQEMVLKDLSFFFMLLAKNTAYMVLVIILKNSTVSIANTITDINIDMIAAVMKHMLEVTTTFM